MVTTICQYMPRTKSCSYHRLTLCLWTRFNIRTEQQSWIDKDKDYVPCQMTHPNVLSCLDILVKDPLWHWQNVTNPTSRKGNRSKLHHTGHHDAHTNTQRSTLEADSFDLVVIWGPQVGPSPSTYVTDKNYGHTKQCAQCFVLSIDPSQGSYRSWKKHFNGLIAFNAVIKQFNEFISFNAGIK